MTGPTDATAANLAELAALDAEKGPAPIARWIDLYGCDPDFTGGKDIREFLEESRGEA